ncbi:hypothetical protein MAR_015434 [Mya arenaria]|uniref:Uncharacterized protein n=1 Tax=Mya arenaria TaxID=6604 RepID=A0ABY7FH15_MYAAR|nr:hypothetical protein MAR_015434 [Mya arenaria]
MALGRIVTWNEKQHIEAASLEGLITHVIEEFVYEEMSDRSASPRQSISSSLQSFCLSFRGHHDFTTPAVSPACSVQTLNQVGYKSFREFLFMTLPLVVHPVVILRLLAHKMFGNMIRRKNFRSQNAKLKPPKEDLLGAEVMCPPRSYSESSKYRENTLKLQPVPKAEKPSPESQSRSSTSANSNSKSTCSNGTSDQMGTNMALRAIVANEKSSIAAEEGASGSTHDVDIIAFQRELINLPTFVMDTPLDVSPVFSRSSSVPENLAGRLNPTLGSLGQLSSHNSRKRLSKSGCGSDQAVSTLVHSGSAVAITMTDPNHKDSVFFMASEESTTNTPEDSMANIIVHFDPPQSPLLSSASGSGSPHAFDFPPGQAFGNNLLQPGSPMNNLLTTSPTGSQKGSPEEQPMSNNAVCGLADTNAEVTDSKASLCRPDALKISPIIWKGRNSWCMRCETF